MIPQFSQPVARQWHHAEACGRRRCTTL